MLSNKHNRLVVINIFNIVGLDSATNISISVGDSATAFLYGDDVICSESVMMTHISTLVICQAVVQGRYLTLRISDLQGTDQFLDICELEIYGKSKFAFLLTSHNGILNILQAIPCLYIRMFILTYPIKHPWRPLPIQPKWLHQCKWWCSVLIATS